ncbi:hypothetical protein C0585_06560 [Candidatus Woesearchaeota archaeon]|nr:MAG: hypothetical protein C0585_06560 [Candidatus Woesearchaeota archaeon]
MANDYAIVPEEDFSKLKNKVDKIESNPFGESKEGKELVTTLKDLNSSMSGLVNLFNTATEELKIEEHDSSLIAEKVGPLFEKIETLESQNEKIAKGIVAVADMVKELKMEIEDVKSQIKLGFESKTETPKPKTESFKTETTQTPNFPDSGNMNFNQPNQPVPNNNTGMNTGFQTNNSLNDSFSGQNGQGMKPLPMDPAPMPQMGEEKNKDSKKGMFHF